MDSLKDEKVFGTSIHGIFDNSKFTRDCLNAIRKHKGLKKIEEYPMNHREYKEWQYDKLAQNVREHVDMDIIFAMIERRHD